MFSDDLNILYEDTDIIVCVKPPGIASETRDTRQPDMVSLLRNYRAGKGEDTYIGMVHRLDQPVEGILVFGKNAGSTAALNRQLTRGGFSKIYLAVTQGDMPAREGRLQDYLKKDGRSNTSCVVPADDLKAKKAELAYHVLRTEPVQDTVQNLVRIQLLTGRHHQIRVQFAHLGTPIAGDRKYGKGSQSGANSQFGKGSLSSVNSQSGKGSLSGVNSQFGKGNLSGANSQSGKDSPQKSLGGQTEHCLMLCASELEFFHPATKKKLKFQIEPSWAVSKITI